MDVTKGGGLSDIMCSVILNVVIVTHAWSYFSKEADIS